MRLLDASSTIRSDGVPMKLSRHNRNRPKNGCSSINEVSASLPSADRNDDEEKKKRKYTQQQRITDTRYGHDRSVWVVLGAPVTVALLLLAIVIVAARNNNNHNSSHPRKSTYAVAYPSSVGDDRESFIANSKFYSNYYPDQPNFNLRGTGQYGSGSSEGSEEEDNKYDDIIEEGIGYGSEEHVDYVDEEEKDFDEENEVELYNSIDSEDLADENDNNMIDYKEEDDHNDDIVDEEEKDFEEENEVELYNYIDSEDFAQDENDDNMIDYKDGDDDNDDKDEEDDDEEYSGDYSDGQDDEEENDDFDNMVEKEEIDFDNSEDDEAFWTKTAFS